jgi:hypothetical protein
MPRWPLSQTEVKTILRFKQKLGRRDPLRGVVDALLSGSELPPDYAEVILSTLEGGWTRRHARGMAIWAAGLAPLGPDEAARADASLISLLKTRSGNASIGVGCCFSSCCLLAVPLAMLIPFLVWGNRLRNELREMAAVSMGRIGIAGNLYPLCDAIAAGQKANTSGEKGVAYAAAYSLDLILRSAGPPPSGALAEPVQASLCTLLREASAESAGSILNILRIAGSSWSIRAVERYHKRARDPELVAAATETLESLLARQSLEADRATLLRPAIAPQDPGFLLRPATNQPSTDEALLLRPQEGSE